MARPDLTNEEIEQMGRKEPGSAREYLRARREELEAEKQAERARDDYARFEQAFVNEGGAKEGAKEAYTRYRNERALQAALTKAEAAEAHARREAFRSV